MVNYSLKFIKLLLNHDATTIDVKQSAEVAYTADMQAALKDTVWTSGCQSWYYTADGWNSTVYPYSQVDFWRRCTFPKWDDWNIEYTDKGLWSIRRTRALRVLGLGLVVVGAWRARQAGLGVGDVSGLVRELMYGMMARLVELGAVVKKMVST